MAAGGGNGWVQGPSRAVQLHLLPLVQITFTEGVPRPLGPASASGGRPGLRGNAAPAMFQESGPKSPRAGARGRASLQEGSPSGHGLGGEAPSFLPTPPPPCSPLGRGPGRLGARGKRPGLRSPRALGGAAVIRVGRTAPASRARRPRFRSGVTLLLCVLRPALASLCLFGLGGQKGASPCFHRDQCPPPEHFSACGEGAGSPPHSRWQAGPPTAAQVTAPQATGGQRWQAVPVGAPPPQLRKCPQLCSWAWLCGGVGSAP